MVICWSSPIRIVMTELGSSVPGGRLERRGNPMKKKKDSAAEDELRPEYDLSKLKGGVRGKYLKRYRAGTNLALLAPDVRAAFPTDEAVNQALRLLLQNKNQAKQVNR